MVRIKVSRMFEHSRVYVATPAKFCSTNWRCSRTVLEHLELF